MSVYIGKAALSLVPTSNGAMAYVYAGQVAPEGIVPEDLKRLLNEGYLEKVDTVEDFVLEDPVADHPLAPPLTDQFGVAAAAANAPASTELADSGDSRPPQTANKDIWLAYRGLDDLSDEQKKALTKDQLQDDTFMASYQRPATA